MGGPDAYPLWTQVAMFESRGTQPRPGAGCRSQGSTACPQGTRGMRVGNMFHQVELHALFVDCRHTVSQDREQQHIHNSSSWIYSSKTHTQCKGVDCVSTLEHILKPLVKNIFIKQIDLFRVSIPTFYVSEMKH